MNSVRVWILTMFACFITGIAFEIASVAYSNYDYKIAGAILMAIFISGMAGTGIGLSQGEKK